MKLIDKDALVAEIVLRIINLESTKKAGLIRKRNANEHIGILKGILSLINSLEVIYPYEQCVQYASIEAGIKAHAEDYSFNIESELFNQLTKEQQKVWRKEIEQACISGGYSGLTLAKDPRYEENSKMKEVDFKPDCKIFPRPVECYSTCKDCPWAVTNNKAQKGEEV